MALVTRTEYRAITTSNKEMVVCAEKMSDVALALESDTVVLNQISVLREVQVVVEDPVV
jgi:hypothetical protein